MVANIPPNDQGIIEIPENTNLMVREWGQEIPNTAATVCDDRTETICTYPECDCLVFAYVAVPGYSVFVSRSHLPNCDICSDGTLAEYDASLPVYGGSWANVCKRHFLAAGCTLGVGRGQRLIPRDD